MNKNSIKLTTIFSILMGICAPVVAQIKSTSNENTKSNYSTTLKKAALYSASGVSAAVGLTGVFCSLEREIYLFLGSEGKVIVGAMLFGLPLSYWLWKKAKNVGSQDSVNQSCPMEKWTAVKAIDLQGPVQ